MQADNLDFFKKLIFITPDTKKLIALNFLISTFSGIITYLIIRSFTSIDLGMLAIFTIVFFIYLLPALTYAKTLQTVFKDFKRNWSYLISATNQIILFFFILIMLATDTVSTAWSILWAALITIYMFNIVVLGLVLGKDKIKRIVLTGSLHSIIVLLAFHLFLGRQLEIPWEIYALNLGFLAIAGLAVLGLMIIVEYLMTSNISNISAFNLTSSLLQGKSEKLNLGYVCDVEVQNLEIENSEKLSLVAPWVHPGPITGFGGGDITKKFIEKLNSGESKGFFLHVPSNHKEDLVNPEDQERLFDSIERPQKNRHVSKMIHKDIGFGELYGRRIGEQEIVYINIFDYDDYNVEIFKDILDMDRTILIDLHEEGKGERKEMYYGTSIADKLRAELKDFIEEVRKLDTNTYKADFKVSEGHKSYMCLVEEVENQKTAILGFDYNGVPEEAYELRNKIRKNYDHVILFSTDAHSSLEDMAEKKTFDTDKIEECLYNADKKLEESSVGLSMAKTGKIDLIKEDYSGLIFSINILVRIMALSLIFIYTLVLVWVL